MEWIDDEEGENFGDEREPLIFSMIDFAEKSEQESFPFSKLPTVVIVYLFEFLPPRDVLKISALNKKLNKFVNNSNRIWEYLIRREFDEEDEEWKGKRIALKDSPPCQLYKEFKKKLCSGMLTIVCDDGGCEKKEEYIQRKLAKKEKESITVKEIKTLKRLAAYERIVFLPLLLFPLQLAGFVLMLLVKYGYQRQISTYIIFAPFFPSFLSFIAQSLVELFARLTRVKWRKQLPALHLVWRSERTASHLATISLVFFQLIVVLLFFKVEGMLDPLIPSLFFIPLYILGISLSLLIFSLRNQFLSSSLMIATSIISAFSILFPTLIANLFAEGVLRSVGFWSLTMIP